MEHWCTMGRYCVDNQYFPRGSALLPAAPVTENRPVFFLYYFQQGKLALEITKQNLPDHIKCLGEILETRHMVDLPPSRRQWGTKAQRCMLGSQVKRQFGANIPFPFSFFHIFHLATVLSFSPSSFPPISCLSFYFPILQYSVHGKVTNSGLDVGQAAGLTESKG